MYAELYNIDFLFFKFLKSVVPGTPLLLYRLMKPSPQLTEQSIQQGPIYLTGIGVVIMNDNNLVFHNEE